MSNPPDPTLTIKSILDTYWENSTYNPLGVPKPVITTPAEQKRFAFGDTDVIHVYSVVGQDIKRGLTNAYRDRIDKCTIDIATAVSSKRAANLRSVVENILDAPTVRSSPSTRPSQSAGDDYDASPYDQIIPINHTTKEDVNRRWFRIIIEVDCRKFWEAR